MLLYNRLPLFVKILLFLNCATFCKFKELLTVNKQYRYLLLWKYADIILLVISSFTVLLQLHGNYNFLSSRMYVLLLQYERFEKLHIAYCSLRHRESFTNTFTITLYLKCIFHRNTPHRQYFQFCNLSLIILCHLCK